MKKTKYQKKVIKEAKRFQPWDFSFIIELLYQSILQTRNYINNKGYEVKKDKKRRIKSMDKALSQLKYIKDDDFIGLAKEKKEYELKNNIVTITSVDSVYKLANTLEKEAYKKAFKLISKHIRKWWD